MKKIIYLLSIVLVATMISCEEDENVTPDDSNSFRIKEILENEEGQQYKTVFNYQDNLLVSTTKYFLDGSDWTEDSKMEYTYSGNLVTGIHQYYENTYGWRMGYKMVYNIENNLLTDVVSYRNDEGTYVKHDEKIFEYSDSKLINVKYYEEETLIGEIDINYQDNMIKESLENFYGHESKTVFTTSSNKYVKYQVYDKNESNEWEEGDYMEFNYLGDKINKTTYYDWFSDSGYEKQDDTYYYYDSNGLLIEIDVTLDDYSYTYSYSYESGKGNAKVIYNGVNVYGITPTFE